MAAMTRVNFPMLDADTCARVRVPHSSIRRDLRGVLALWGFAVVDGVLPPAECAALEGAWAADLRAILPAPPAGTAAFVAADPPRRWPLEKAPLSPNMPSYASNFGIPQGRFAWGVRRHPRVKEVFEVLFEGQALCVNMDVVFFANNCPPENEERKLDRLWPHCDHSLNDKTTGGWEVFQSVVYVWPADEGTSATVLWPKSHGEECDILHRETKFETHYCPCGPAQKLRFAKEARRIPVAAGSMVIWSSRTIHQEWGLGPRLALAVCFEPIARRTEEALKRKLNMVKTGGGSTHWASLASPHNCSHESLVVVEGIGTLTKAAHLWISTDPAAQNEIEKMI